MEQVEAIVTTSGNVCFMEVKSVSVWGSLS